MMEKYTLEDGGHIKMVKVKNLERVFNLIQKNIFIMDILILEKEMVKGF